MRVPPPVPAAALPPAHGAPGRRPRLALVPLLLALLLALGPIGPLAAVAARAESPRSVTVIDQADVLNDGPLTDRLREIGFRRDVDLVALTVDVEALGYPSSSDVALNDATLELARREHPEWLSPDGMTWADGLLIIAIDPTNRFLGTSAGEDVKLPEGLRSDVEKAMRQDAQDAAWDDAIVQGASTYASLLGRPWYLRPGLIVTAAIAGGIALILAIAAAIGALARRRRARAAVDAALPRYDDVMLHDAETELAARTIPTASRYGAPVLLDYDEFTRKAAAATRLREQLPARRPLGWGIRPAQRKLAEEFAEATAQLDAVDDEIARTNDLLNRASSWRDAWAHETAPLRESLDGVNQAAGQVEDARTAQTAQELRAVGREVAADLRRLTEALEQEEITPDDALAELDRMTGELAKAADAHRDMLIETRAIDKAERRLLRRADDGGYDEDAYGTIRARRRHYVPRDYADSYRISPVIWLNRWESSSSNELSAHRAASSGGGASHTGFSSSSSGGFSGASSSSRF